MPGKWDTMLKGQPCDMVPLKAGTPEYDEVKSKFEKTMASSKTQPAHSTNVVHTVPFGKVTSPTGYPQHSQWSHIVKIERVQNPFLHAQYVAKKKSMDQQNPSNIKNERELFHGCPGDVALKISHQGFNRSFAGKNGKYVFI